MRETPLWLSYETILQDSGLIFYANGRDGGWDRGLGLVNPAADKLVKDYLCLVSAEQLQVRETSKQATPFFVNKLTWLAEHLQRSLGKAKTNTIFWAFYCGSWPRIFHGDILQWWPAQWPGSSKNAWKPNIPKRWRVFVQSCSGKNTDRDQNVFRIRWNPQVLICSEKGIELYMDVARQIGINLAISYLFCPTTTDNGMRDEPLGTTTAEAR